MLGQGLVAVAADANAGATQVRLQHTIGVQNAGTLNFTSGTTALPGNRTVQRYTQPAPSP
jgi:hypothetical protein